MLSTFAENLEKYAELALKIGVNLQPDQNLYIDTNSDCLELARVVTRKAYELGARNVYVDIADDALSLIRMLHAPEAALKEVPQWKIEQLKAIQSEKAARLAIIAPNADLLKDVDADRIALNNRSRAAAVDFFRPVIQNGEISWNIIAAPTPAWAAKVFPELPEDEAMAQLWEKVFYICRVSQDDPVSAWRAHMKNLKDRLNYLNEKNYRKLHYKATGTDLVIEFHEKHQWLGGDWTNYSGVDFVPNIPTEEVFSLPLKTGVNGTVRSTKPLNYSGNLINNFSVTFKDGRIVDFEAEQGYDTFKHLVAMDDNAHYLGEVALVPHHSPISDTDLLFYNTLYDENASCHLAIGSAYPTCLEGGTEMDKEQLEAHGCNISLTHVDFMVGAADLDIDGITADGKVEPVFRNGNWAF